MKKMNISDNVAYTHREGNRCLLLYVIRVMHLRENIKPCLIYHQFNKSSRRNMFPEKCKMYALDNKH